jgi:hypothetical protein
MHFARGSGMSSDVALQQEWESAEIHRSSIEAGLTDDASLAADESNIRRYMNPPLDTPFSISDAAPARTRCCWLVAARASLASTSRRR